MVHSKVQTVIVNHTEQALVLKVGSSNCYAKLGTIAVGGEHKIEIDVNWTYQEFYLEPAGNPGHVIKKMIISSDVCCDYERITVTMSDGSLQTDKIARGRNDRGHDRRYNVNDDMNKTAPGEFKFTSDRTLRSWFTWLPKRFKFNWRFWH